MNAAAMQRAPLGSAHAVGREPIAMTIPTPAAAQRAAVPEPQVHVPPAGPAAPGISADLYRTLAEVKGQAQFLLYLADQIEDSLDQLVHESESSQGSFLCKVLGMYSAQLESKHHGLGDKIAETCQEVYVTVREYDTSA